MKNVKLEQFLKELSETDIDIRDDEAFMKLLGEGKVLFGLTDHEIATQFEVSRPSVTRWLNGRNAPHPVVRPVIYSWLRKKAKYCLRQLGKEELAQSQARRVGGA